LDPHRLAAIAWTGIVTTVLAIYFQGVALQTASASDAALTFASEPVWASLFGVWLLHEQLNTNAYIGGSIILLACILGVASDLPGGDETQPSEGPTITS
jgi:drug/metabolite transporter (DMT)-like permease